jgi:hypothetical protein
MAKLLTLWRIASSARGPVARFSQATMNYAHHLTVVKIADRRLRSGALEEPEIAERFLADMKRRHRLVRMVQRSAGSVAHGSLG